MTHVPDPKIQAAIKRCACYAEFIELCHDAYHAEPLETCGTCQVLRQISEESRVPVAGEVVDATPVPDHVPVWRRVVCVLLPTFDHSVT